MMQVTRLSPTYDFQHFANELRFTENGFVTPLRLSTELRSDTDGFLLGVVEGLTHELVHDYVSAYEPTLFPLVRSALLAYPDGAAELFETVESYVQAGYVYESSFFATEHTRTAWHVDTKATKTMEFIIAPYAVTAGIKHYDASVVDGGIDSFDVSKGITLLARETPAADLDDNGLIVRTSCHYQQLTLPRESFYIRYVKGV